MSDLRTLITTTGADERYDHRRCSRSLLFLGTGAVGAGGHRARLGDRRQCRGRLGPAGPALARRLGAPVAGPGGGVFQPLRPAASAASRCGQCAGCSYREMQAAISHQAVGLLIRSPRTARSVMATGPASGSARTRPPAGPGGEMHGACATASQPAPGTQCCRPTVLACLGIAFAVTPASSRDPPRGHAAPCKDEPRPRRTGPEIPQPTGPLLVRNAAHR
jgi:hypothetical protein